MATEMTRFYCLRCQHRFDLEYDKKQTVEKTCPACSSNSVRVETPAAAERWAAAGN
jgi:Zn finger protein HypA/HybF involved in hydrogenase expression